MADPPDRYPPDRYPPDRYSPGRYPPDRYPPYRRPDGAEDLFTPAAGLHLPGGQPGPQPASQPGAPRSRREARAGAHQEQPGPADPAAQPQAPHSPHQPQQSPHEPPPWPLGAPATRGHDPHDPDPAPPDRPAAPEPAPGRWWTVPLAALLLLGWAAAVFADVGGLLGMLLMTLATTAPFVTALAVPIGALAARRRRWESLAVTVVAGALPWAFVLGYATADPPPTDTGAPVTVLVVNAHDGRANAAQIVAEVRNHDVDVLVVTELSRTLTHELTAARLPNFLEPRWFEVHDAPDEGLGVWSRLDLTGTELVAGTTWPAVSLQVQTPAGDLTVIAGHVVPPVPSGIDDWRSDLAVLRTAARGKQRTLLAGSFNASPWNAQYRQLLGSTLVDAADVQGAGLRPTWPAWTPLPLVPLDSALVTKDLRVISADTVPLQDTDHRALLVSLEVPGDLSAGG